MDWLLALGMLLIAFFAAVAGLLTVNAIQGPVKRPVTSVFTETTPGTIFMFDGETMIDSTEGARMILASSQVRGGNWLRLISHLSKYFPNIEEKLKSLTTVGTLALDATDAKGKPLLLLAELRGGITRIVLTDPSLDGKPFLADPLAFRAQLDELDQLRNALAEAPMMIWRENTAGEVVWSNAAYLFQAVSLQPPGRQLGWPLPRIFEKLATQQTVPGQRAAVTPPNEPTQWFDLIGKTYNKNERLLYALPADAAVHAENALRDFMQTLTKTFAQLPIGLAIFDRQRNLQLFNPAVMDLTGLPADFLSMRPSLLSVLDALRDQNILPEPKDYRSWRRQLVEIERAAASGLYEETWNLPDGQTYKVIGRPHPNGALALIIEDVTNEVSRTRRYRQDLELGQSVIDTMDEALAVFSPAGHLVMSNQAYSRLWHHDPETDLGNDSIRQVARHWRSNSAASSLWQEVEEYISTVGDRLSWEAEARLLDGRLLACRFAPLAGGATLAAFRVAEVEIVQTPRLTESTDRLTA